MGDFEIYRQFRKEESTNQRQNVQKTYISAQKLKICESLVLGVCHCNKLVVI